MIWNINFFHRSAISVVCILYTVWTWFFFFLSFFFGSTIRCQWHNIYADNGTLPVLAPTLMDTPIWGRPRAITIWHGISKLHFEYFWRVLETTSQTLKQDVLKWGAPQLSKQHLPGPNPLPFQPDWDLSYCGGHWQLEPPWAHCKSAVSDRTVWWNPYCSWPSHLRGCLARGTGAFPLRTWRWTLQTGTSVGTQQICIFFNFFSCWTTHQLTKINATLPYKLVVLEFWMINYEIIKIKDLRILRFQNSKLNWVHIRSLFFQKSSL